MSEQQHSNEELASHAPGLPTPAPAMPHSVPAGYFEQLSATILERIRLESDELPTILSSLKQKNAQQPGWPYQTPADYFEQTSATIPVPANETAAPTAAPVIPFHKRSLLKYAVAAAVLAPMFGVGRWYQLRAVPDIETDPANWVRNEVKRESTEKIDSYINGSLIETTELSTDHKQEIALLTIDIDEKEILNLLNETDLLAAATNESSGSQKILN
ncbi:MAG: hypothetical protein ACKOD1_04350 [Sphingomonadales bacterium]